MLKSLESDFAVFNAGFGSGSGSGNGDDDDDDDDEKPPVTLRQRAYPLIDLLKRAQEEDCDVLWDKG